jgi:3-methylfumaryl-CoA hydratase
MNDPADLHPEGAVDSETLSQWIGRTESANDQVSLAPITALAATLDRGDPPSQIGDWLPPCWHWLFFLPLHPLSAIGMDGHPKRGGFLPPVPLPRRMWAGSRIDFHRPLMVGSSISRTSRIANISAKSGRSGELVFVRLHHEIANSGGLAITEEQDLVYRGMSRPGDGATFQAARTDEQFSRRVVPDPVLLFRYSALTFNGHRIHYDRPYATDEEGYPGLVVHGPLLATLLIDLFRRTHSSLKVVSYEFKAVSPLFDLAAFDVCGRLDGDVASLWARGPEGQLAMQASAIVASA